MSAPESSDGVQAVDPTTRLILARLAAGTSQLALASAARVTSSSPSRRAAALGAGVGPRRRPAGTPTRVEVGALAAALVAATLIGAALPGSPDARAQTAPTPVYAQVPIADQGAVASVTASSASVAGSAAETHETETNVAEPTLASAEPAAEPAAVAEDTGGADSSAEAGAEPGADDDSDPLAGGGERLDQVALVIVHGDAPALWPAADANSAAGKRAASGTTLTGFATLPGAPLATSLGLIAGQASNPLTRAGCAADASSSIAPGPIDDLGRVAGAGCNYPAGTPSIASAVAIDGRRWRAYTPVAEPEAAPALCGTGAPNPAAATFSATSALRRLTDLATSGACESAAAPLSALADDLNAHEPPAWLLVEVGACGAPGCDAESAATRDRDLDAALTTLTGKEGLGERSAVIVVGDGSAAGLEPAPAGSLPAAPDDPQAPAAVITGALLLGPGVSAGSTDPLPLDPFALARTQADWLGVDAPGWAKADGVSGLAVPSG